MRSDRHDLHMAHSIHLGLLRARKTSRHLIEAALCSGENYAIRPYHADYMESKFCSS
jgi:hypothetical protein